MKILILGNINCVYKLNYVKELKNIMNCEIDILTVPIQQKEYVRQFIKYFNNIYEISKNDNGIIDQIPKIRRLLQLRNLANQIDKLGNYDICHIHYLSIEYGFLTKQILCKCKKLVISIWGSDFYRTKWLQKKIQYRIIKHAHKITFANKRTLEGFKKYFKLIDDNKFEVIRFGSSPLNILKNIHNISIKDSKKLFNISTNDLVVVCGNNASQGNQHLDIIKAIQKVKQQLPYNILFLFPFTYSFDRKYYFKIKELLDRAEINYKILTDFLSDYKVAKLRKVSDIMINTLISDQLSASMIEHLYAENIVITGNWLPYDIFDKNNIFLLKVSSVDEIGEKLVYVIKNYNKLKKKCKYNKELLYSLCSWENSIKKWKNMYAEVLKNAN